MTTAPTPTAPAKKAPAKKPAASPAKRPAATPAPPLPFRQRLAQAMADTSGVGKTGQNHEQGYKFATAEAILGAVRKPLFERGIVLTQHIAEIERKEIVSRNGGKGEEITVHVDFTFLDAYSDESFTRRWVGVGQDYGDKAIGKALTSAVKTFVRGTWLLPTEHDDPERDAPKTPRGKRDANDEQKRGVVVALTDWIGQDNALRVLANVEADTETPLTIGATVALMHMAQALNATRGAMEQPAAEPDADAVRDAERQAAAGEEPQDQPEPKRPSGKVEAQITAKAGPPPGTVRPPAVSPQTHTVEEATDAMRAAGCICADPLVDGGSDNTCPIMGHGQPVM